MRVVVAPDKFAGSLTAVEAADAIIRGWSAERPMDEMFSVPMADGGPGTVATVAAVRGELRTAVVTGPLGAPVEAFWLQVDAETALIESAEACGLHLVEEDQRDPRVTTTYGVGELILAAVAAGATQVVVGLGGSATNDGGAGCLQALGLRLLDGAGDDLPPGGAALARLHRVDAAALDVSAQIELATDVQSPLCGPSGATSVFGPQKGADAAAVAELDAALLHLATVLERDLPGIRDLATRPVGGAAGGLGAGLLALGATDAVGAQVVGGLVGLDAQVGRADLVLTGEGRFDETSLRGKVPAWVAGLAQGRGLPCVVLAGEVAVGRREMGAHGFDAAYAAVDLAGSREAALAEPARWLAELAGQVAHTWSSR